MLASLLLVKCAVGHALTETHVSAAGRRAAGLVTSRPPSQAAAWPDRGEMRPP